ncbi:hypothetical protein BDZ97DRAFT_1917407 [Flammula alnicola]|nr:hypothetical protein BDZ97DRAFT_1917407 [Flammula alnicola]
MGGDNPTDPKPMTLLTATRNTQAMIMKSLGKGPEDFEGEEDDNEEHEAPEALKIHLSTSKAVPDAT